MSAIDLNGSHYLFIIITFHVKGFFLKSKQEQTENELYYLFDFNLIVENETISSQIV